MHTIISLRLRKQAATSFRLAKLHGFAQILICISGNDDHIVPLLSLGGKGVISVVSNIAPQMTHDLVESFFAGDLIKSRQLQFKLNPLVKAIFSEVNPIPIKTALNMIGINAGILRMPLCEMRADHAAMLKKELIAFGFDIA